MKSSKPESLPVAFEGRGQNVTNRFSTAGPVGGRGFRLRDAIARPKHELRQQAVFSSSRFSGWVKGAFSFMPASYRREISMQWLSIVSLLMAGTPIASISPDYVGSRMIAVLDCALGAVPRLDDLVTPADVIGKSAIDYCSSELNVWHSSYRLWAMETLAVLPSSQQEQKISEGMQQIRSQMNDTMTIKVLEMRAATRARRK